MLLLFKKGSNILAPILSFFFFLAQNSPSIFENGYDFRNDAQEQDVQIFGNDLSNPTRVWKGIFWIQDLTKIRCGIWENAKYLDGNGGVKP